MRAEPDPNDRGPREIRPGTDHRACLAVALAVVVGLFLLVDSLGKSSATYDEVTYQDSTGGDEGAVSDGGGGPPRSGEGADPHQAVEGNRP